MKLRRVSHVQRTILIGYIAIVILSQLISGAMQYHQQSAQSHDELRHVTQAVMQPVVNLATRAVDGGNLMVLSNADAKTLYKTSGVKYLKISGVSRGAEKTDFSEAIPPQPVSYEYVEEGLDKQALSKLTNDVKAPTIEENGWLFIFPEQLKEVKNGGQIVAILSAEKMRGMKMRVLTEVLIHSVVVIIVALVGAIFIGRRISKPIVSISQQITDISKSLNLNARVQISDNGEIGKTAAAFNSFVDNVRAIVDDLMHTADRLHVATVELRADAAHVTKASREQTEHVGTTVDAMKNMIQSIAHVADYAKETEAISARAKEFSTEGEDVVTTATQEMFKIESSVSASSALIVALGERSDQINNIVSVIKEVADQTNLLALNAAIEAARAGEQGRGFAVVADEVRKLAERTTNSTHEITDMIETIQNEIRRAVKSMEQGTTNVHHGVILANKAKDSLGNINHSTQDTLDMIRSIAVATGEQNTNAHQIANNVGAIAGMAQENSAIADKTSISASELEKLAANLKNVVQRFSL